MSDARSVKVAHRDTGEYVYVVLRPHHEIPTVGTPRSVWLSEAMAVANRGRADVVLEVPWESTIPTQPRVIR